MTTCSLSSLTPPTPPTRRPFKRLEIKSAIPLLPPEQSIQDLTSKYSSGTNGNEIEVYCNHFPVTLDPDKMLYQYDVLVEKRTNAQKTNWDEVLSRDQRRQFVQALGQRNLFNFIYWLVVE